MGKQKKGKKKADRHSSQSSGPPLPADAVDDLVAEWRRIQPDLDATAIAVVSRVQRLAVRFSQALEETCAVSGLTRASFDALAALARGGHPGGLSQTQLMQALALTPGTVSVRITRLVRDGLVDRRRDPQNARGVIITMTPDGVLAFERALGAHLATQRRLLDGLDPGEQERLANLLRRLLQPVQSGVPRVQ